MSLSPVLNPNMITEKMKRGLKSMCVQQNITQVKAPKNKEYLVFLFAMMHSFPWKWFAFVQIDSLGIWYDAISRAPRLLMLNKQNEQSKAYKIWGEL